MIKEIVEKLSNFTILDIIKLTEELEKKWNISSKEIDNSLSNNSSSINIKKKADKNSFDLYLQSAGNKRIKVISLVKKIMNIGLKEAKDKIDSVPTIIKESISKEEAEKLRDELENEGAKIELK